MLLTPPKDWPHAPIHRFDSVGTYMVTAATLNKEKLFVGTDGLNLLERTLLSLAKNYAWALQAWAVFANHYHFVGRNQDLSGNLGLFLKPPPCRDSESPKRA